MANRLRWDARRHDRLWFNSGQRLCFTHRCLGKNVDQEIGDGWWIRDDGKVSPSIHCLNCGAHFVAKFALTLDYLEGGFQPWYPSRDYKPKGGRKRVRNSNRRTEGTQPQRPEDVRVERRR